MMAFDVITPQTVTRTAAWPRCHPMYKPQTNPTHVHTQYKQQPHTHEQITTLETAELN